MKQLLVIGGSYFAGRVFVESLSQRNQYQIHLFNRGHLPVNIKDVDQIKGDREIPANISQLIPARHWDAVVDFCAYTPEHVNTLLGSISGTIGHYIFISTTSIYAPTQKVPIVEQAAKVDSPQPELGEFAEYGYQKWRAEYALEKQCRSKHIPYTILRPSIIYGRYNYAPRESFFFDHVIADEPLVVPENHSTYYSFVWVDDMARIIMACLENEKVFGQAYNVASDEMISFHTMADIVEEVTGRKIERKALSPEEIIRQRVPMPFPPDEHLLYDGEKLNRAIGFEHTPFILGITETWKYYQKVVQRRNGLKANRPTTR